LTWQCYDLLYEAKAPIHIGFRTLGIVSRTRYYILGKNFWGALTATLARKIMKNYDPRIYEKVGEFVRRNIIFTHFYVYEDSILYPQYQKGLRYGSLYENEFERRFISSYVSTALEKSYKSAEEKSLHEVEFIKPHFEKGATTRFFGHVFIQEGLERELRKCLEEIIPEDDLFDAGFNEEELREMFSDLWVGGERNYGFGRVKLLQKNSMKKDSKEIFRKYRINLENLKICIDDSSQEILALSHVRFDTLIKSIKGEIEPLVGREWGTESKIGVGQKISQGEIYLAPGTEFTVEENAEIRIGDFGTWKIT
jgi:hypothetical protein